MTISTLSSLALDVWRYGLRDRGAHVYAVVARVERALGVTCDPESVSLACRDLVRSGHASRSALGYRAVRVRQACLPAGE